MCPPKSAGGGPDWHRLQLIDFAFSLSRSHPLRFVLPIDADRIDYLPYFYRQAIRQAQASQKPEPIDQACCAEIDVFSLGVMLEKIMVVLASHGSDNWVRVAEIARRCKQLGGRQPSAWRRWFQRDFAQLTTHLLREFASVFDSAAVSAKPVPAAATPLQTPLASSPTPLNTPLAPAQATPMATPLAVSAATPLATSLAAAGSVVPVAALQPVMPAALLAPEARATNPLPWVWWGMSVLLAYLFYRIDRVYVREGFLITDVGYYLSLTVFAATPLWVYGMWQRMRRASASVRWWLIGLSSWLALVVLYFYMSVRSQGVGVSDWLLN